VELVGCEDEEAGNPDVLASWVVHMTDNVMSLMISNGCYAVVRGLIGLKNYDFNKMPKSRTETEQK
jgi:hypothetical protein